jgi:hypothetical protein
MMPFLEVQRAHDLLHGQVTGEVPRVIEAHDRLPAKGALDVLCWMLGHTHNGAFARNLVAIEKELGERGYVLTRAATEAIDQPVTAESLAEMLHHFLTDRMREWNEDNPMHRPMVMCAWERLDAVSRSIYVERCARFLELFDVTQRGPGL